MKKVAFLSIVLYLSLISFGQSNSIYFLTEDYNKYYLLEINPENNTYVYSAHCSKRIRIDKGTIHKKGKRLILKSDIGHYGFNKYLKRKVYLRKNKLYFSKFNLLVRSKGQYDISENEIGLDYKFQNLDKFSSTDRIVVERVSESMNQFRGLEFEERFKHILNEKLPEYFPLVSKYYLGPEDYTHYINDEKVNWDQDVSGSAILDMFSTIIHESTHHANGSDSILIYPDSLMQVVRTDVIPTKSMTDFFVSRCSTDSIFRFRSYIKEAHDNLGSNVAGIYGLMNEFSAYYHDTRSAYLMYKAYDKLGEDYDYYKYIMIDNTASTFYAYYEFNLFMGGYLSYLKTNNKKLYLSTIENKSLRRAYTIINNDFKNIVNKVEAELSADDSYLYHFNKYVKHTKKDLIQFLPVLEKLKDEQLLLSLTHH